MFWLLIPLACGSASPERPTTSTLSPDRHEVRAVVAPPKNPSQVPTSELAHGARAHCPKVLWADFAPDQASFGTLTLRSDLPFKELQVALPEGKSASAKGRPSQNPEAPEGAQEFAIACRDCTLMLVFEHQGTPLTCEGPGMSLTLAAGALTPWLEN